MSEQSAGDTVRTGEAVTVEWVGGLGDTQTVHVDSHAGEITVDGRVFGLNSLSDPDVPNWMFREAHADPERPEDADD